MVAHTTNPTRIIDIPNSAVSFEVIRNQKGELDQLRVHSFDKSSIGTISSDSRICMIAKARHTEIVVDLGKLESPDLPKMISLDQIDKTKPLHLRIIVFNPFDKKILASCEKLSAYEDDEQGLHPLLPVEAVDLGEQLWRLQADNNERPILQVNNDETLDMFNRLRSDSLTQALVIPAALEQVFRYLQYCKIDDDELEEWKNRWKIFLDQIDCRLFDSSSEEIDPEWAKAATVLACRYLKLKSRAVKSLEVTQ